MTFNSKRNTWTTLLLAPALLGTLVRAVPFGTVDGILDQHAEHEMITRLALQCADGGKSDGFCFEATTLDNLAGANRGRGIGKNGGVGSPDDVLSVDGFVPEGPEAHCDDADFLDVAGYPRTRAEATETLQACISHLRIRFSQANQAAARLVLAGADDGTALDASMSDFSDDDTCRFGFRDTTGFDDQGRAKCNVLEGLGRALHGVQDFYAHSNWADVAAPGQEVGVGNPPGLNQTVPAPFLDLRLNGSLAESSDVPRDLSTGCFDLKDAVSSSLDSVCDGRISHDVLNKDHGEINLDGTFGEVGQGTPRGAIPGNFERAVNLAVEDTRLTWTRLQATLKETYGEETGDLMICALVRDDPVKDCGAVSADGDENGAAAAAGAWSIWTTIQYLVPAVILVM